MQNLSQKYPTNFFFVEWNSMELISSCLKSIFKYLGAKTYQSATISTIWNLDLAISPNDAKIRKSKKHNIIEVVEYYYLITSRSSLQKMSISHLSML